MSKQTKDLVAAAHQAFAMDEISLKQLAILSSAALHKKSLHIGFLCATSVFSVSLWCVLLGIHQPRRHREHRDYTEKKAFVTFCGKPSSAVVFRLISTAAVLVPRSNPRRQPPRYITHVSLNVSESLRRASNLITWWFGEKCGTTGRDVPIVIHQMMKA